MDDDDDDEMYKIVSHGSKSYFRFPYWSISVIYALLG